MNVGSINNLSLSQMLDAWNAQTNSVAGADASPLPALGLLEDVLRGAVSGLPPQRSGESALEANASSPPMMLIYDLDNVEGGGVPLDPPSRTADGAADGVEVVDFDVGEPITEIEDSGDTSPLARGDWVDFSSVFAF